MSFERERIHKINNPSFVGEVDAHLSPVSKQVSFINETVPKL